MNKQKWLEDRFAEINRGKRVTDSLFEGLSCETCSAIHGTNIAGGVR